MFLVAVVLVVVALVRVVHVARLVAVMLMRVALVRVVRMLFGAVLVAIALVRDMHMAGLVAVMFVVVTLVNVVMGLDSHMAISSKTGWLTSFYHVKSGLAIMNSADADPEGVTRQEEIQSTLAKGLVGHKRRSARHFKREARFPIVSALRLRDRRCDPVAEVRRGIVFRA